MRSSLTKTICVLVLLLWSVTANAQPTLRDVVSTADHAYGSSLTFTLSAQSDEIIETAVLFAAAPGLDYTYTTPFTVQGQTIDLSYTLDLTTLPSQPRPFAPITYWWELITAAGQTVNLERQTFRYTDNRFDWQQTTGENWVIYWPTTGESEVGAIALDIATTTFARFNELLPLTLAEPVSLYIYPSMSELRSTLRLGGWDWRDGYTDPVLGVLLVVSVNPRTARDDLSQSIPQEMGRFFLYQATQEQFDQLPRWLVEGLGGVMLDDVARQRQMVAAASSLLNLCTNWPTDPQTALLATSQSQLFTRWLHDEFGRLTLNRLVHVYRDGQTCAEGLSTVTNVSLATLEQQWRADLQGQSPLITLIRQNGLWFLLLTAGFLLTALILLSYWQGKERGERLRD